MGLVEGEDFLSPQIIYLDASAVSKMGRHTPLEPMTGCPAWVKREVRNSQTSENSTPVQKIHQ
eukprot:scaffold198184_cov31-Attheya_sp.AAC.1